MAVGLTEKYESRKVTVDQDGVPTAATLIYNLFGIADETTARTTAFSSTAATYGNLTRSDLSLDPVHVDTNNAAACIWEVTVNYAKPTVSTNSAVINFDTTGGTQHVQASIYTRVQVAAQDEGVVENHGLIGVSEKGGSISVEGVDVTVPVYSWTETHKRSDANINQSAIYSLTGKVNNAPFKGFAAGEVLFMGATGNKSDAQTWEVTYRFAASPNKSNFTICGGKITVDSKKGWEYLWVRYRDDATDKAMVAKPVCAYIEVVYEEGNLSGLGI